MVKAAIIRCSLAVLAVLAAGCSDDGDAPLQGTPGCEDAVLRELPTDPGQRGPWAVGARTFVVDDLTVEVWYPAEPGAEAGVDPIIYDFRDGLPESERSKVSDAANPLQPCDCYRDLPPDTLYGPYPVIVFIHGTAGIRNQSLPQMVHWASRGFVVLAADHPGLKLGDLLGSVCGFGEVPQDLRGDVETMLAAARGEKPGLEFLGEALDATRVGLSGHSAGGRIVGTLPELGQVIIPLAARDGVQTGGIVESVLIMGGTVDSVVPYDRQQEGFDLAPSPKRLVGIENAGHLAFSELCALRNAAGEGILTVAIDSGICGADFASDLFQCGPDLIPDRESWEIINYASSAAFEETLHCRDATSAFENLETRFPAVAEYRAQ